MKTVVHTLLGNEKCKKKPTKKWEQHSIFGSVGSVRGKVSASFAIEKKIHAIERVEIMRFQTACQHVNKKMDVSTNSGCFRY